MIFYLLDSYHFTKKKIHRVRREMRVNVARRKQSMLLLIIGIIGIFTHAKKHA